MRPGSGCGYREACCHGMSALLSPWTGRDSKGEGRGEEETISGKEAWRVLVV